MVEEIPYSIQVGWLPLVWFTMRIPRQVWSGKNVKTVFGEERGMDEFEAVRNAGEDKMAVIAMEVSTVNRIVDSEV